jgi:hypothetical protein
MRHPILTSAGGIVSRSGMMGAGLIILSNTLGRACYKTNLSGPANADQDQKSGIAVKAAAGVT